jgi:preprotein translocase subunit SecE
VAFLGKIRRGFQSTFSFFGDSWSELRKVKWPSRKELVSYTLVVLGTVIFVAVYFYVIDLIITWLLRLVFER